MSKKEKKEKYIYIFVGKSMYLLSYMQFKFELDEMRSFYFIKISLFNMNILTLCIEIYVSTGIKYSSF